MGIRNVLYVEYLLGWCRHLQCEALLYTLDDAGRGEDRRRPKLNEAASAVNCRAHLGLIQIGLLVQRVLLFGRNGKAKSWIRMVGIRLVR